MKKIITFFCLFIFLGLANAQQASDYFPSQTGFEWKFKAIPLDSVSNPINSLAYFRIDSFASVANYEGKLANIVPTKTGSLQSILLEPFLDSLFYATTEGTNGFEYFSIRNIEAFLIALDEMGIDPNFSFVDFFTSLQDWYDVYRFGSTINTPYNLVDTNVTIAGFPINFKYIGKRLQDQTIPTVLGNFECKKFLLQWRVVASSIFNLLTLNDTIWIAQDNWIVQDIIPGQYVESLTLFGVDPFTIYGLQTKLTDEIVVSVANEQTIPDNFSLEQNYPNPFNPTTNIGFRIADRGFVSLKVFDILGNEVATLVNEELQAGEYKIVFDGTNRDLSLTSGVYFYQLKAGSFVETKKMLLLK